MNFIYSERIFEKKSCDKLIDFFEKNKHLAKKGDGGNAKLNNLEINIKLSNPEEFDGLGKKLVLGCKNYGEKYPLFKKIMPYKLYTSFQLCRFEPGNHYSSIHCENDGNPKYLNRVLAWMIYLNDIADGGGTEFLQQETTLEPIAGNLYIWPAGPTHMHRGVVSNSEKKYFLTGWYIYS